jgi:hypothetical protein
LGGGFCLLGLFRVIQREFLSVRNLSGVHTAHERRRTLAKARPEFPSVYAVQVVTLRRSGMTDARRDICDRMHVGWRLAQGVERPGLRPLKSRYFGLIPALALGSHSRSHRSASRFDGIINWQYKSTVMRDNFVSRDLRFVLASRQLSNGGWPAVPLSSQASLETSALAYLALVPDSGPGHERAVQFLTNVQNSNGSWPAFEGDDQEGSWTTSLVLIALRDELAAVGQRLRAYDWLLHLAGRESHWLWRWKFRTTDRHVRFDPEKFGWPWIPDTNSWVVPTAFAILALNQLPCACGLNGADRRLGVGIQMLFDRACPAGGWNAGNGVVYGSAMVPHPDDTAIALLALPSRTRDSIVPASLDWLERVALGLSAPWSLAWSILALAAHHRPVEPLVRKLACWLEVNEVDDTSTLAVSCLALDHAHTLARLGIAV